MAKIRVMSNQRRVGRVGDTTYYVRDSEQIARQSRNNSNYGASASRSFLQQSRRVRWANLVNLFKTMRSWQPKAYEFKKSGQTDYNLFVSLNINSTDICLTKDMAQNGCACWDSYQISRGSLSPIQLTGDIAHDQAVSSLITSLSIAGTTTIGELSADIIANNVGWENGDNLAIIGGCVYVDDRGYPYADSNYLEMTLNVDSNITLSDAGLWNWIGSAEGKIIVTPPGAGNFVYTHCALIHTRKVNGRLLVSTQSLVQNYDSPADQFKGSQWQQQCIDSYGETAEVPLDPSFSAASISSVTANGSAIRNAQLLSGNQTIRVYGTGLDSSAFRFSHDNVTYAPLSVGDGYVEFLCGDNGNYFLYLGDEMYMTFRIEGITVPDVLPNTLRMQQMVDATSGTNLVTVRGKNCINYPYKVNESYPQFRLQAGSTNKPWGDGETSNWSAENFNFTVVHTEGSATTYVRGTVVDPTAPAWIMYQGFIVAVFNYE